jgi:uncharacterized protein YacL
MVGYFFRPFSSIISDLTSIQGAFIGGTVGILLTLIALKIKKAELRNIWSAAMGTLIGIVFGLILYFIFNLQLTPARKAVSMQLSSDKTNIEKNILYFQKHDHSNQINELVFFNILFLFGLPATGFFVGMHKPSLFAPANIREFFKGGISFTDSFVIDTSAIIDGRILPVVVSGFIEGEIIITQFVLAELQAIADSSDSQKKLRGRRGLDVIEQLRSNNQVNLTILNKNPASVKSVDQKIMVLAKEHNYKIVTNDINLSKIAKLQDIKVLNINELAFALKPIVFPGEHLKAIISKEGKEKKQGLAYLEDGTMVVVDDAKNDIGKKLDIEVTSVLQSTSGKMIFGKKL